MVVGLAAKNAILIVEFANELRAAGTLLREAAVEAARERFRPILMTSFAFILGVAPLLIASGAGAQSRHSIGTGVFFGMLARDHGRDLLHPALLLSDREPGRARALPPPGCHAGAGRRRGHPALRRRALRWAD